MQDPEKTSPLTRARALLANAVNGLGTPIPVFVGNALLTELCAEVERLTSERDLAWGEHGSALNMCGIVTDQRNAARAEVERLRRLALEACEIGRAETYSTSGAYQRLAAIRKEAGGE